MPPGKSPHPGNDPLTGYRTPCLERGTMHVAISYGAVTIAVMTEIGGEGFEECAAKIVRDLFGDDMADCNWHQSKRP